MDFFSAQKRGKTETMDNLNPFDKDKEFLLQVL